MEETIAIHQYAGMVFPNSRHRLCQWHIHENVVSLFGSLKHDNTFKDTFNKCLKGCYNQEEFEECWNKMIADYGLEHNSWFQRLYGLRDKWCTALSKDFFSAGILSSQRSESTNNAIGFEATMSTSLTDFYRIFNDTVKRWRSEEEKNEFACSRSVPSSYLPMVGMLKHAGQIYTLTLFRHFEIEFGYAIGTDITALGFEGTTMLYEVSPEDQPTAARCVTFDPINRFVSCSCRNFEESGMLCFHCIRVLHWHSVKEIPERYICSRCTKYAKTEVWNRVNVQRNANRQGDDSVTWRRVMLNNYYNLILKCRDDKEARTMLEAGYKRDFDEIGALLESRSLETEPCDNTTPSLNVVLDPVRCTTKGRSARKKRQLRRSTQKGRPSSTVGEETSTYTPPPRLI